jgi:quercetin dioxygenase-like cupin family protein
MKPIIRRAKDARVYSMGSMTARFIADGDETGLRSSVSEWWLEPNTEGPPLHSNPEDHLFYVLAGEIAVYLESEWHIAEAGTYVFVPGGVEHGFENRSAVRSGFLNINTPGGFEEEMPEIVDWFAANPPGEAAGQQK